MLDVHDLVLPRMVKRCTEVMGVAYPDLLTQEDHLIDLIWREEERFRQTLERGSSLLDAELEGLGEGTTLDGEVAFVLHDTYGFPLEVTQEMAEMRGARVDVEGFDVAMARQRERSRAAGRRGAVAAGEQADAERAVLVEHGPTSFTGRDEDTTAATVVAVIGDAVFLDRSPFYAESGGQVGDTGTITTDTGSLRVLDTTLALPGLHRHRVEPLEGRVEVGQAATASIDAARRAAIRRNHTATHLLHWSLREVLGEHVKQQGSMVGPDRLRFDFSHHRGVTPEELVLVEDLANAEVLSDAPALHFETSMDEARELGAIAFFGDKYGDVVRVLQAGPHSLELCGGTHVGALGEIGTIKIVSEGSIGSNVRRIEAVTGTGALELLRSTEADLQQLADALGVPRDDLLDGLSKRLSELRALRDEIRDLRRAVAGSNAGSLADAAVEGMLVAHVEADTRDEVRELALALRDRPGMKAVVLGGSPGGKGVALVAAVTPDSGLNAAELIAEPARVVGGGGGRAADVAMAGGKFPERLDEALALVRDRLGLEG
jgi:alanyl-tRNA synthetase